MTYLLLVAAGAMVWMLGRWLCKRYDAPLKASPLLAPMSDGDMRKFKFATWIKGFGWLVAATAYVVYSVNSEKSLAAGVFPLIFGLYLWWRSATTARYPAIQHFAVRNMKATPELLVSIFKHYIEQGGTEGLELRRGDTIHCVDLVTAGGKEYHFNLGYTATFRDAMAHLIANFGPWLSVLSVDVNNGVGYVTNQLIPSAAAD